MFSRLRNKKGQAAMEFLMTYGWAILIAIIAIAALIAFGVLNVGRTTANICTLTAPLECKGGGLTTTQLSLDIYNGGEEEVTITQVKIDGTVSGQVVTCTWSGLSKKINPESRGSITEDLSEHCTGGSNLATGKKFKGTIALTFTLGTGTAEQISTGSFAQTIG